MVAVCSGIGPEAARRSTEMVIELFHPEQVVSAGFAGAIDDAAVGEIIEPRMVINAADGSRTDTGSGEGVLVSVAAIADQMQKAQFGQSYGAVAVDMEAASVALGAQARGVRFRALKVISDASDFSMPDMDRFVSADGNFRSAQFALHVALRPAIWGRTIALACNSAKASRALSAALDNYIRREFRAQASDQTSNNERGVKHPVPETQDARSAHS